MSILEYLNEPEKKPVKQGGVVEFLGNDTYGQAINDGLKKQSNTAARVLKLQAKTGLPAPLIERNIDEVEHQASKEDFNAERFRQDSPMLADWLAKNPNHVAVAKNDTDYLSTIESAWDDIKAVGKRTGKAALAAGPRFSQGAYSFLGQTADLFGLDNTSASKWLWERAAANKQMAEYLRSGEQTFVQQAVGSGVESAVTSLMTIPFALARGGKQAYTLGIMGLETAGVEFQKAKDMGVNKYVGTLYGLGQGSVEVLTEKISLGRLVKDINLGSSFWKTLGMQYATESVGEQIATAWQDLNEWAVLHPEKTLQNYWEERPEAFLATAIAVGVGTGLQTSVLHGTYKIAEKMQKAGEAKNTENFLKVLGENLSAAEMTNKSPEAVRSYIEHLKEGSGVENIYIDVNSWDKLFQSDAELMADELGIKDQYVEAKALNADLVIPIETYAEKIATTPLHQKMIPDIRLGIHDLTKNEADAVEKGYQKALEDELVKIEEQGLKDAPINQVYDDVYGQMIAIGAPRQEAERIATIESQRQFARAERLGKNAWELWSERPKYFARQLPEILKKREVDLTIDPLLDQLRSGKEIKTKEIYGESLVEFLKKKGGLKEEGGELSAMDVDAEKTRKKLIQKGGMGFDAAAELAAEQGYIDEADINKLLAAIDQEIRGEPVFKLGLEDMALQSRSRQLNELSDYLDSIGVDLNNMDNAEVRRMLKEAEGGDLYQQDQTETEAFKKWFGDSKVVDEDGKPLVVYHGTDADFNTFDANKGRKWAGKVGFWFADNGEFASLFGEKQMPVYLTIKNPKILTLKSFDAWREKHHDNHEFWINKRNQWESEGYDGIIVKGEEEKIGRFIVPGTDVIVAFKPEQIKSAIGNRGTFDPNDPNILHQDIPETARGMYNRATNTITLLKKANPSTALHELAHSWLEELKIDAARPDAPQQLKDDWAIIVRDFKITEEEIPVSSHEEFARGIEKYVMEGKAPSLELRNVFQTFVEWLKRIYKKLSLNVELTDETRAVFDRLLATDEQINRAREMQGYTKELLDSKDMTAAEYAAYRKINEQAKTEAENTVRAKVMNELVREQQAWWKKEREEMLKEVNEEISNQPAYRALHWLRYGTFPDGTKLEGLDHVRLSKEALVQRYGEAFLTKLPRPFVYTVEGGIHPDLAAEYLGFESGEALVKAIAESKPRKELVEAETDSRMRQKYGDMMIDMSLADEAAFEAANDRQIDVYLYELKQLKRRGSKREIAPLEVMKTIARSVIQDKKVGELDPRFYERAIAKAGQEAEKALLGKEMAHGFARNLDVAFDAKQKQILNMLLFREATKQKQAYQDGLKGFKALFKRDEKLAKTRNMDLVNAARAVVSAHGVGLSENSAMFYMEQMQKYDEDTFDSLMPLVKLATVDARPFAELSVAEFGIIKDAVDSLWEMASNVNKIEIEGRKRDRIEVTNELIEHAQKYNKSKGKRGYDKAMSKWDKFRAFLSGAKAFMSRMEYWVDVMDRGDFNGKYRSYIYNTVNDSVNEYRDHKRIVLEKYRDIAKTLEGKVARDKIEAGELNYTFGNNGSGKAELLGALLHTGNESNLQKLLRGKEWGQFLPDGTLDTSRWDAFIARMWRENILTKEDYDFIQAVWDLNEELKPEAQKAHKKMYGYYFEEITANPVVTPFGTYRGGYMPAIVDSFLAEDAARRADAEALEKQQSSFMFPTTGRGFTKSRVNSYAAPLIMDVRLVSQHLDKVLRFIHLEPRVKDVGRLVNSRDFRGAMAEYINPEVVSEMIIPWLQRTAQQVTEEPFKSKTGRMVGKFFREVRSRTGLQIMAANVVNTLQQFTGLSLAALKVHPHYLASALWRYVGSPLETRQQVVELSKFMRNRTATQAMEVQNELDRILLDPTKLERAKDFAIRHGYFMQTATQSIVDVTVWIGAYDQALANKMSPEDAIKAADSAVRMTQSSFNPEDMSRVEVQNAFVRLFTMFYNYFNMQANLIGSEFSKAFQKGGFNGSGRAMYVYLFGFMIPAVMAELIVKAFSGADFDKDDDGYWDDFLAMFFGSQARVLTAMAPGGQFVQAGINRFNDKWYDDRVSVSPAISSIESTFGAPYSLYKAMEDEGRDKKAVRDTLYTIGMVTGLPVAPLGRPLGYLADINEGYVTPENELDLVRGLITGKAE